MALFERRPLMLCCFCFLTAAVVGFCINKTVKIIILLSLFLAVVAFFATAFSVKTKQKRILFAVLAAATLFSAVSVTESFVYYDIHGAKLSSYIGSTCDVECTVLARNKTESYLSEYTVKLTSIDGESVKGRAVVQFPEDMGFKIGERVRFPADCVPISEVALGNSDKIGLLSDGVLIAFVSECELDDVVSLGDSELISESFKRIQKELSYTLQNAVGGDAGALSSAVTLGDRDGLSDEIKRDFSRSGLSHLLSLSGMHMAIIASFFCYLLKLCYVPRRIRSCVMPIIMVIYLCLTGFSLPTLRATVMLSAVYLSFVLGVKTDARTVLFASGTFIIAFMPYAVCDVGFWMSFLATLGLIVFYPSSLEKAKDNKKLKSPKYLLSRLARKIFVAVTVTLIAVLSVILLTQMFFGELSLISPLSNLLVGFSVMIITVLSMLWLLMSGIPYIGTALSFLIRVLCNYVIRISEKCSDIKNICVSFESVYAKIIIWCFCAAVAVLLIIKLKNKRFVLLAPISAVIIFCLCFGIDSALNADNADATYIRRGESETLTLVTVGKAVIFDMTDGNYTNYVFSWNEAHRHGATELDTLILTHYHDKHEYSVSKMMSVIKVRRLMIPEPEDNEELFAASALQRISEKHGADCVMYKVHEATEIFNDVTFVQYERGELSRSAQDTLAFKVNFGDDSVSFIGSSYFESMGDGINEYAKDSKCVIYGSHGPNPKKEFTASAVNTAHEVIFADEELFGLAEFDNGLARDANITVNCERYETYLCKDRKSGTNKQE